MLSFSAGQKVFSINVKGKSDHSIENESGTYVNWDSICIDIRRAIKTNNKNIFQYFILEI